MRLTRGNESIRHHVMIPSGTRYVGQLASMMAEQLSQQTGFHVSCCQAMVSTSETRDTGRVNDEWIGAVRFQLITTDSIAVTAEAAGSSSVVPARFQSMLRLHYADDALP